MTPTTDTTSDRYGRFFEFERSSAVTVADARTRAAAALIRRGYRITADEGKDPSGVATLEFTRGSRLRSVVAMSPDSWYVTGRIHLDPDNDQEGSTRVRVELDATRSAQVPSLFIGAATLGAIIGNRLDGSDGSAAFIFSIVGFLVGAAIIWRWLGLSGESPTS